ncbi:transposase [Dysgonomonas sp. 520]|uniref:ISAon1 family transposase n=1 Tax=Dysgonomonas sp. 520 TaxID=2302931 RepID=UPI0013D0B5B0|nr:transposase [Dysgonomonas sp. 520]NDW09844.1 DDE transposase [Dysgonomonas sp. 520]
MDNTPVSCSTLAKFYGLNAQRLEEWYRIYLSGFLEWSEREHADKWLLFPENISPYLSIDETSLSDDELYTIITNKEAKGRKGSIVSIVRGTKAEDVIEVLLRIKDRLRHKVKEVTLDMAANMGVIVTRCFPKASQVTDRFHVQKLACDALQDMRIAFRWKAIEQENKEIALAKENKESYVPLILENGDTHRQLLIRSRYLLFKNEDKWTPRQRQRAEILFHYYPTLEVAYKLTMQLKSIYHTTKDKKVALTRLARWYNAIEESGFEHFGTVMRSVQAHYKTILNFFDRRATNASAESFNAKIKAFRATLRGVNHIPYFLFRLKNIYA